MYFDPAVSASSRAWCRTKSAGGHHTVTQIGLGASRQTWSTEGVMAISCTDPVRISSTQVKARLPENVWALVPSTWAVTGPRRIRYKPPADVVTTPNGVIRCDSGPKTTLARRPASTAPGRSVSATDSLTASNRSGECVGVGDIHNDVAEARDQAVASRNAHCVRFRSTERHPGERCDPLTRINGRPTRFGGVRLGVLDVGSNTVHLLVVDARRGGHPTPMSATKASLRLAETIDSSGKLTRKGADQLIDTIDEFAKIAASSGCAELMAFHLGGTRRAQLEDVLARVLAETVWRCRCSAASTNPG